MHRFTIPLVAAAAFLAAGHARAADPEVPTVKVRHADLDLASAKGRATLDRRLAAATENVCGSYSNTTFEEQERITACRAQVRQQVATQIAGLRARDRVAVR